MSSHDPYAPIDPPILEARLIAAAAAAAAPSGTSTGQSADPAVLEVPKGTSAEVLSWVGEDRDKAQLALSAENAHKPRKGLVEELTEILDK